jgi:5-bromo-4-chloroindolyl phosphate hydrolysis protein
MKDRIIKLLSVKSIVTIILTAVFAFLAVTGKVSADQFLTVFSVVVAFYFGTQHEKNGKEGEANV